jgi:hypothetical protein
MVVLEDNIHWEVPDLSTRCYCSRPVAEETGRMVPEKGIGRRRDRRLDGPEEDTLVVDRICLPLWCLFYGSIDSGQSRMPGFIWVYKDSATRECRIGLFGD